MKTATIALAMICLVGCGEVREIMESRQDPADQPQDAAKDAAGGGAANGDAAAAKPADDGKGIIGKMTNEVLDMPKALKENPDWEVMEDPFAVNVSDPLSAYASAYIAKRSQVSLFGFQGALRLYYAQHERHPTYDEFMKMMIDNRIKFAMRPHYQKYAYDAKDGKIVILEDTTKR